MSLIKDKRGVDPSTFTWIGATLVILILALLYLVGTIAMAASDSIKTDLGAKIGQTSNQYYDFVEIKKANGLLVSKITVNGKEVSLSQVVGPSLNFYFENKFKDGKSIADLCPGGDLDKLYSVDTGKILEKVRSTQDDEKKWDAIIKEMYSKNNDLAVLLHAMFKEICPKYIVKIPQGLLKYDQTGILTAVDPEYYLSPDYGLSDGFSREVSSLRVNHFGRIFNIRYKLLESCKF